MASQKDPKKGKRVGHVCIWGHVLTDLLKLLFLHSKRSLSCLSITVKGQKVVVKQTVEKPSK